MSEPRFVKVATYTEVYQADLAKSALEDEGIAVQLHDRETVSMDWLISSSVGGIKVKVPEADAERAIAILAAKMSNPGSYLAESLSEEELARQALAAEPEQGTPEIPPEAVAESEPDLDANDHRADAAREEYAKRFHRAAVYALILSQFCFVFWFYAVYLGLNAVFSPGRLSAEGQRRILFGFIACCSNLMIWLFAWIYLGPYFRSF